MPCADGEHMPYTASMRDIRCTSCGKRFGSGTMHFQWDLNDPELDWRPATGELTLDGEMLGSCSYNMAVGLARILHIKLEES